MATKKFPRYLRDKVARANRLMSQIVDINIEIENWLESHGVSDDGYDYLYDFRESEGYDYVCIDTMVDRIDAALEG